MAGELESAIRNIMSAYDGKDWQRMNELFTADAQGVDELSRKWMRGNNAMNAYFTQFGPMLSDIKSDLTDFNETVSGDMGIVTLWIEQDYKLNGEPQHFSGPMTAGFRREGANWRAMLIHAVPMPPADA